MSATICPVCEAGQLHAKTKHYEEDYHGQKGQVELYLSECDTCGSEISSEQDLRRGRRALIRFRKKVDGLLSGLEIREFRHKYGLSQAMANQLFGGGAVAFSRYESDELMQSAQMDQLLRLCIEDPENLRRIARQKGVKLPHEPLGNPTLGIFEFTSVAFATRKQVQSGVKVVFGEPTYNLGKVADVSGTTQPRTSVGSPPSIVVKNNIPYSVQ